MIEEKDNVEKKDGIKSEIDSTIKDLVWKNTVYNNNYSVIEGKNDLLRKLSENFPNVEFSGFDITKLMDSESERDKINPQIVDDFVRVCEILNDDGKNEFFSIDLADKAFKVMYENNFSVRPKDPIIRNFYEIYEENRQIIEENRDILEENERLRNDKDSLMEENRVLTEENKELKEKNSKLEKMLQKTVEFCQSVKRSKVGKIFFSKEIKGLSRPDDDFNR